MDLAQATNAPEPFALGGETYPVRVLKFKEWGDFTSWIKARTKSPLTLALESIEQARASGQTISMATEDTLLDHAQQATRSKWPPRLGSEGWFAMLDEVDGGLAEALYCVLSKTTPAIARAKIDELIEQVPAEELAYVLYFAILGVRPIPKDAAAATTERSPSAAAS